MRSTVLILALLLVVSQQCGCSWQQAYGGAQAWQRNACDRIPDAQERARCMASTDTSYEDYRRQVEAEKNRK